MEWCNTSVQGALTQARNGSGVIAFQVLDDSAGSSATVAAWTNPQVSAHTSPVPPVSSHGSITFDVEGAPRNPRILSRVPSAIDLQI